MDKIKDRIKGIKVGISDKIFNGTNCGKFHPRHVEYIHSNLFSILGKTADDFLVVDLPTDCWPILDNRVPIFKNLFSPGKIELCAQNNKDHYVCDSYRSHGIFSFLFKDGVYLAHYINEDVTGYSYGVDLLIFDKGIPKEEIKDIILYVYKVIADEVHKEFSATNDNLLNRLFLASGVKEKTLQAIDLFLESKSFYDDHELPWKLGILMVGPPGNGKTLFLKALGKHYGMCPDNVLDYEHDGKLKIPRVYGCDKDKVLILDTKDRIYRLIYGAEAKPRLFYLEDLDKVTPSLLHKRENLSESSRISLSELLSALDGVNEEANHSIIIATTNYRDSLIEALTCRPGRFDLILDINKPDKEQIKSILDYYKFVVSDVDIINKLNNFSMAFVEYFIKTSILKHKKIEFKFSEVEEIYKGIIEHNKGSEEEPIGFGAK